ncbi:MAG: PKD domain-containing protein, partial [Bacteroidota bacterium]
HQHGLNTTTEGVAYPHQVVLWKNQPNIYMRPASCFDGSCGNLDNGQFHQFQLDWDPNLQLLQVYIDGQLLISYLGDVVNQFFGGNPEVIIGFTGGTGIATNEQRFCWTGITGGQQGQLQELNFPPIPDRYFSDGPLELTASASSGLPVNVELLEGPAVLQGDSLLFTGGSGQVSIRATQPGDSTYLPAIPIVRSFQLTDTTPPPNLPPTALILLSPDSGEAPLDVLFDGTASSDPEGDSLSYHWDLGNGDSDTQAIFSYPYDTAGVFLVVLTVSDGVNASSDSATVWVFEPPVASCDSLLIDSNDFEGGLGIWNDGGADCALLTSKWAYSGTQCIRLQDDSPTSVLTTDPLDLTGFSEIIVDFTYLPLSMGQPTDDFWLQVSTDGGATWTTVEEWNRDDEFTNKDRHFESIPIAGPFTANTLIRFRCDATNNGDHVYIDDISLRGCSLPARRNRVIATDQLQALQVFPNPAESFFWLGWEGKEAGLTNLQILGLDGKQVLAKQKYLAAGAQQWKVNTAEWARGLYLIRLWQGDHYFQAKVTIQ